MNEDPLFSGGVIKAALIVLVAGALGVGAFLLAGGGIDLPEVDFDEFGQTTTNLTDTELADTTIGDEPEAPAPDASDPFTTAAFGAALKAVQAEAGPGRKLTRLFINPVQTQFIAVTGEGGGDGIEAFSVRQSDPNEVVREEATITITGNATIDDFAFALDAVDPGAIDRMLSTARKQHGGDVFQPTVVSLERRIPFGDRALEWSISAEGGNGNLTYRAQADGSQVRDIGGGSSPAPAPSAPDLPSGISEAQELGECIERAGQDQEKIFDCLER